MINDWCVESRNPVVWNDTPSYTRIPHKPNHTSKELALQRAKEYLKFLDEMDKTHALNEEYRSRNPTIYLY